MKMMKFNMMQTKKWIAMILTVIMILPAAGMASADSNPLLPFYDAAEELLFRTENVTLNGEAVFSLNGERFKTAEVLHVQDGTSSQYQLRLLTPRRGGSWGTDRESGYTIIANTEDVYVMEAFYPGVYKVGSTYVQHSVLRNSVQTDLMTKVARILAGSLPAESFTVEKNDQGGEELRMELGEDAPEMVNTALNLFWQFAAKRYFEIDYDIMTRDEMGLMEYYITPVQAILGTTQSVSLKQAKLTAALDESGCLEQVSGEVSLLLNTGWDGIRELDATFSLRVSDRGASHVDKFDPEAWGVTLREGWELFTPEAGEGDQEGNEEAITEFPEGEEREKLLETGRAFWLQAGFETDPSLESTVYRSGDEVFVEFFNEDFSVLRSIMLDPEGKLLWLQNESNNFQGVNIDTYNYDGYPDQQVVEDAKQKVLRYLEEINPEILSRIDQLGLVWWYEIDGELYFEFQEEPIAQEWDGVLVTVRVRPEWRIEVYSITSNG